MIVAMIAGSEHEITATTAITAAVRSDDPAAVVGAIVPICGSDTMACNHNVKERRCRDTSADLRPALFFFAAVPITLLVAGASDDNHGDHRQG